MSSTTRFLAAIVACILMSIGPSLAQEREWTKLHETIEMDGLMAEYTEITTSDDLSPDVSRLLYADSDGVLLVIRDTIHFTWGEEEPLDILTTEDSITLVSNGEELTLGHNEGNDTMTLTIGPASVDYSDDPGDRPLSPSIQSQAQSILTANASQGFQDALYKLARTGSQYSNKLYSVSSEIAELFYPELEIGRVTDYTTGPTEVVENFDPYTTPPGTFELQFGQAYYE